MEAYQNRFLSGIELFLGTRRNNDDPSVYVEDTELHHICNVMRHKVNDIVYLTDGKGTIFKSVISEINRSFLKAEILETFEYEKKNKNVIFCLPLLKSSDRMEIALEKCVEFGITNLLFFTCKNSVMKMFKKERFQKIVISAMKQSLNSHLPQIEFINNVISISELPGKKFLFLQEGKYKFNSEIIAAIENDEKLYFIFGPEGGFTAEEISCFSSEDTYFLTKNRLRSESSIILTAGLISLL